MKRGNRYVAERVFVSVVILLSITGFWNLYLGDRAIPNAYHHLHALTNFSWLFLILYQVSQLAKQDFRNHRKIGLSILLLAPLLVASSALLSVHSAHKGVVSGQGDFLIVQNVMATFELALFVFLAFALRKRRALHGAFLLGTGFLFMGIALFFTLVGFVPGFRIEGPETFHRFETAATTIQYACIAVGLLFFTRDPRNGWPMLLAGACFLINDGINTLLAANGLIDPLTRLVGSMSQPATFLASFTVLFAMLAATGIRSPALQPA